MTQTFTGSRVAESASPLAAQDDSVPSQGAVVLRTPRGKATA